jgi:signal peptidase II
MAEDEETPIAPATLGERSWLFLVTASVIIIDHLTKLAIEAWLPLNHSWAPWPDRLPMIRLTHVSNTGAAFGMFPSGRLVFALIAAVVALVILAYNYRLPAGQRLLRLALGLQLAGALGNLIDRVRLGHVTDFVDIGPWPVFNVADMSIVAGVIILGFLMVQEQRAEKRRAAETSEPAALDPFIKPPGDSLEDSSLP